MMSSINLGRIISEANIMIEFAQRGIFEVEPPFKPCFTKYLRKAVFKCMYAFVYACVYLSVYNVCMCMCV